MPSQEISGGEASTPHGMASRFACGYNRALAGTVMARRSLVSTGAGGDGSRVCKERPDDVRPTKRPYRRIRAQAESRKVSQNTRPITLDPARTMRWGLQHRMKPERWKDRLTAQSHG